MCASQPSFNVEGEAKGRFCKVHKRAGMVDVSKRCEEEGCASFKPNFNVAYGEHHISHPRADENIWNLVCRYVWLSRSFIILAM